TSFLLISLLSGGLLLMMVNDAQATVVPGGFLVYSSTTPAGSLKYQVLTNPNTWGTIKSFTVGASSNVRFVVHKDNPTRNTKIAGLLKADGSLDILLYNATSTNNWTYQFTVSGVGTTSATFMRSF